MPESAGIIATNTGSVASNTYLLVAAVEGLRLGVITDHGLQRGYLLGLDEHLAVLWGQVNTGEDTYWTSVVVPRSLVFIVEREKLADEEDQVREQYQSLASPFLAVARRTLYQLTAQPSKESV